MYSRILLSKYVSLTTFVLLKKIHTVVDYSEADSSRNRSREYVVRNFVSRTSRVSYASSLSLLVSLIFVVLAGSEASLDATFSSLDKITASGFS
jgi:hypothetical protein